MTEGDNWARELYYRCLDEAHRAADLAAETTAEQARREFLQIAELWLTLAREALLNSGLSDSEQDAIEIVRSRIRRLPESDRS